ncbi:MAG: hypothetical protein JWR42_1755 [Marmoricola sp.]|nr:hypothetical protein [Marmoricola sp.]
MSRGAWFVVGAGAGVYAMTRARRAAESFTPDGLRDRWAGLALGAHLFGEEVRAGQREKETELRTRLGLDSPDGPPEIGPGAPPTPHDLTALDQSTTTEPEIS